LASAAVSLGVFLRIDGLDRKSLWFDEIWTIYDISQPTLGELLHHLEYSPQPPLYYAGLWGWVAVWGLNDITIRLFSAIFGVLTIPVLFVTWRNLLSPRAMLWALSLQAMNAYHISYSQDAKMYSMVWLLATASSGCFLHAISDQSRRLAWLVGYGVCTGCLPFVSYVGIAPLVVQVLFGVMLLVFDRKRRGSVIDVGVVALLAMMPILFYLQFAVAAASNRTGISWIPELRWERVPIELYRFIGVLLLGYRPSQEAPSGLWGWSLASLFGPCVLACLLMLSLSIKRTLVREWSKGTGTANLDSSEAQGQDDLIALRRAEVTLYLALWFLVPVLGSVIFSLSVYSLWGVPRYLFAAAPALLIWLGLALGTLRHQRIALSVGTLLLVANLAVIAFERTHVTRIPWREVARSIADVAATIGTLDLLHPVGGRIDPSLSADLSVCSLGSHELDRPCLQHAMGHDGTNPSRVQLEFTSLEIARSRRRPFVFVMTIPIRPAPSGGIPSELEQATASFTCRQIYRQTVYQEPYTAMPAPFTRYSVEVWFCSPRP